MSKPLVIFGAGEFAKIAHEYFTHDSDYEVRAFVLSESYWKSDRVQGMPVVPDTALETDFPPHEVEAFVAVPATALNQNRADCYAMMKSRGYKLASYISTKAFVWHNVPVGDNCFVFEGNVIQPFAGLGNNCVLWSGNHVGHRTVISDHVFLASHVVVSGYCNIGERSFLGVNATLIDHIRLAPQTLVGAGAMVTKDTEANRVYVGSPARVVPGKWASDAEL